MVKMASMQSGGAKRRGAGFDPANRFERIHLEIDDDVVGPSLQSLPILQTEVFQDESRSVVTENKSPDIHFRFSLNPYRGCEHGCTYCYARPTHETLGLSAGLDFETKIMAKPEAPKLLADFLRRPNYVCEPIVLSGVTDPYQPVERSLRITRQCLEVMLECGQPVELITKNRLILRDLDLLRELARRNLVGVSLAITTLDEELQHSMEPRASSPIGRLDMMKQLSAAGIPIRLLIAPLIPGLTDSEVPSIMKAASLCGAKSAGYVMLRLPYSVKEIFLDWLKRSYPERFPRVIARIREMRSGQLNDSQFGTRMTGTGRMSEVTGKMFRLFAKKYKLDGSIPDLDCSKFRAPTDPSGQLTLF